MSKHTEGPWYQDGRVSETCSDDVVYTEPDQNGHGLYCTVATEDPEEQKANARLIAAVPEMLAALQYIVAGKPGDKWRPDLARELARRAIKKATGEDVSLAD